MFLKTLHNQNLHRRWNNIHDIAFCARRKLSLFFYAQLSDLRQINIQRNLNLFGLLDVMWSLLGELGENLFKLTTLFVTKVNLHL